MEIEMFFAKYDVDGDGEFSYEEGQQLVEDLENDRIDQVWYLLKKHRVQKAFNSRLWRDPGQEKVREDHPLLQFRLISTMRSLECKKFISLFN